MSVEKEFISNLSPAEKFFNHPVEPTIHEVQLSLRRAKWLDQGLLADLGKIFDETLTRDIANDIKATSDEKVRETLIAELTSLDAIKERLFVQLQFAQSGNTKHA